MDRSEVVVRLQALLLRIAVRQSVYSVGVRARLVIITDATFD